MVDQWDRHGDITASGSIEALSDKPGKTQIQLKAEKLIPGGKYQLLIDEYNISESVADKYGRLLFTFTIEQGNAMEWSILREK